MNKETFKKLNLIYNEEKGYTSCLEIGQKNIKEAPEKSELEKDGLLENGKLSAKGKAALKEYRVDNALILAAGASTRCVPLSLELPKGLFEVKGQKLIERQIEQLKEAGIEDISIVVGYKKESFYYLKDKYNVKFIVNEEYNKKNNIGSILKAKNILKNTLICVSDIYYKENPFNEFEYDSFMTGIDVINKSKEVYAREIENGVIRRIDDQGRFGKCLVGHAFWKEDFSRSFVKIASKYEESGEYDAVCWEWLVKDNIASMPDLYYKEFESEEIFEFDYFDELREFDKKYREYSNSEIIENIKKVFSCKEKDISDFRRVNEGMTNISFIFNVKGTDYIYRHPGDGTESIISRKNERECLKKAKELGIDPTFIYEDTSQGWKISKYIHEFREPLYENFEDSKKIISVLKKLHSSDYSFDFGLNPYEDAEKIEAILIKEQYIKKEDIADLKSNIKSLYERTKNDGVEKCFCHGDTYKHNWMIEKSGNVILIDWEYGGYADPGIDVGYYIVDAMYDFDKAHEFINEYLKGNNTKEREFHFLAYVAIIAYYWYIWALYREKCGADVTKAKENWKAMAIKYSNYMLKDL